MITDMNSLHSKTVKKQIIQRFLILMSTANCQVRKSLAYVSAFVGNNLGRILCCKIKGPLSEICHIGLGSSIVTFKHFNLSIG
jgi:hypothetical protein